MRNEVVTDEERDRFDSVLEALIPRLPLRVRRVMEEVPVIVEDMPDAATLKKMRIRHPSGLLGLYHGVSIDRRNFEDPPRLGDVIYLYRLGLLTVARLRNGALDVERLDVEIRKTILHEIGHHHGLDEDDLEELGY
jgi:predicted Zn-dependent protease with MMP-like domain